MKTTGNDYFRNVSDELLRVVREKLCRPCVAQNLNEKDVDFDDPLNCRCRCARVEGILRHAREISANLERRKPR